MFKKENLRKNFLRVKQIADQNLGRVEKTEVLSNDLQVSERRVELVKQVCTNTVKKVSASLLGTGAADPEKRLKKMPEAGLGHSMTEAANIVPSESIMGQMFEMCGSCESTLASKHLQYELDVEKTVIEPLQDILESDIPQIAKYRKQLSKVTLDMDSAKSRWNNAVKQTSVPGVNMASASTKADAVKDELEEASNRVDQAKDAYTTGMFNFISREAEHCQTLVNLLEAQANHHRQALEVIEAVIPKMRETLSCNPTKPVYGVTLEEHLRVANRDIAVVLESCICYLLEWGLEEEGLLRIAGMASKVKKLKASFDAGIVFEEIEELDPHTVAGAMKQYLRELPEPLLTFDLFEDFVAAAQKPLDQRLQALWMVVDKLPKPNYDNFRYLVKFLVKVKENSDVNKMTPANIAIVIGPNLIWSEGDDGPNMMNTGMLSLIAELIIQHGDWFFPGDINFQQTGCRTQTPVKSDDQEHTDVFRSGSNQSESSQGTPQSSPNNQDTAQSQTPPTNMHRASRSPSVSPGTSTSNLQGTPISESGEIQLRKPPRKPAPPPPERPYSIAVSASAPPPPERPYSIAVSASVKPNHQSPQFQTWPRQATPPNLDSVNDIPQGEKQKTLPGDRPVPPERHSSHHERSDRPKIPPPVVPPGHYRSSSTGAPVTVPGNSLHHTDFDPVSTIQEEYEQNRNIIKPMPKPAIRRMSLKKF